MLFGDGAVQAGYFHESVNLAALWQLPVILVCENNGFAEFTPRSAHTPIERVSDVVAPYGFERQTVDGGDPARSGRRSASSSRSRASGRGPLLLECLTHRRRGHYEGDAERYRDPVAEEQWRAADPIARLPGARSPRAGSIRPASTRSSCGARGGRAKRCSSRARAHSPNPSCPAELVYAR